jgi:hypothetical protein
LINNNYFAPYYEPLMRSLLSERNIVVILFVMVLITFSLAQEDSKKMEQKYSGASVSSASRNLALQSEATQPAQTDFKAPSAAVK